MRSCGKALAAALIALAMGGVPGAQSTGPAAAYRLLLQREAAVRGDLDAARTPAAGNALLKRMRAITVEYEQLSRTYRTSGYSDNAGFQRLGLIAYPASAGSADQVFEAAIEAGAEDVESSDDGHEIWTAQDSLHEVARALEPLLGQPESAKLAWRPDTPVQVGEADAGQLLRLIDALDDDDDVQTVWGNYEVADEVMEKLA